MLRLGRGMPATPANSKSATGCYLNGKRRLASIAWSRLILVLALAGLRRSASPKYSIALSGSPKSFVNTPRLCQASACSGRDRTVRVVAGRFAQVAA